MSETKGVVTGQLRDARPHELLADEAEQVARRPRLARAPAPGRRRGGRPGPRPRRARAVSRSPASAGRAVPPAAPGSWAARPRSPSAALAHQREHLLDEERVALGGLEDPVAQRRVERGRSSSASMSSLGLVGRERLEQDGRRVQLAAAPARTAVEQLGPREAEQQDRRVAAPGRRRARRGRGTPARPSGVVEDARRAGRSRGAPRAACATAKAISSAASRRLARRAATASARLAGRPAARLARASCLHDLDDRPVGDALAVGEAARRDDRARRPASRNSAPAATCRRPAAPRIVKSGAALGDRPLPRACEQPQLALPADQRRVESPHARAAPVRRERGGRRQRLGLALQRRAAAAARPRRRRGRARSVSAPSRTSPGCAACSRRAATLTASPVTSVSPRPGHDLARVDADPTTCRRARARLRRRAARARRAPPGARRPRAPAARRRRPSRRRR